MTTLKKRMRPLLGTYVEIGIPGGPDANQAMTRAFDRIAHLQALLSYHDPSSELSILNTARGKWVSLSPPTVEILNLARALSKKTALLFNPFVGGELESRGLIPQALQQESARSGLRSSPKT